MSAFTPIAPRKAVELLEPAGLGDAGQVLVDFAAAGLVKGYARLIETVHPGGDRAEVRDSRIPRELWRRIVDEGRASDVWSSGTVRLAGSDLIGGIPAVAIIGIRFDDKALHGLVEQHADPVRAAAKPQKVLTIAPPSVETPDIPAPSPSRPKAPTRGIPDGAVTVTVNQAMDALGLGRTKINSMIIEGTLARVKIGGRTLITVESIRALLVA